MVVDTHPVHAFECIHIYMNVFIVLCVFAIDLYLITVNLSLTAFGLTQVKRVKLNEIAVQ